MKKYIPFIFLILLACSSPKEDQPNPKQGLKIVCTTGMIGDALLNLVDSSCTVNTIMGPGTDPHLFKPTKASLDLLSEADIIIANGLHLEGRMQDVLEKLSRTKHVFFLAESISKDQLIYADEANGIPDPHIWFDVDLWRSAVGDLIEDLTEIEVPLNNPDSYLKELAELDSWASEAMSRIPVNQRILLTAHDAFSYFGKAYGVEVIGLQGISTVAEYGIRDVSDMVETIVSREIKAVFVESSISSRSIEAVVAGAQDRGFEVSLGGTLYSDALGGAGSGADTYEKMVQHNVNTISNALK